MLKKLICTSLVTLTLTSCANSAYVNKVNDSSDVHDYTKGYSLPLNIMYSVDTGSDLDDARMVQGSGEDDWDVVDHALFAGASEWLIPGTFVSTFLTSTTSDDSYAVRQDYVIFAQDFTNVEKPRWNIVEQFRDSVIKLRPDAEIGPVETTEWEEALLFTEKSGFCEEYADFMRRTKPNVPETQYYENGACKHVFRSSFHGRANERIFPGQTNHTVVRTQPLMKELSEWAGPQNAYHYHYKRQLAGSKRYVPTHIIQKDTVYFFLTPKTFSAPIRENGVPLKQLPIYKEIASAP